MKRQTTERKRTQPQDQQRTRFQVVKLEERIAPTTCVLDGCCGEPTKGHYNPHGKWVGGGRGGRIACF